ncbi:MAG: hypothetical protein GY809_29345 [Planctomycetes bacterium]|nr:hypothetical protein [Planctomycetota bacterium]
MHSSEQNNTGPKTASDIKPSNRDWRSAAVDSILQQASQGPMAIPPGMAQLAFEPAQANRNPQPLGISWLDNMLDGGLTDSEVFLFLAPTGCGKTTLSTQIAWQRAMQQSHTIYVTYDEPLEGYIDNRFYSLITGAPRPDFEKQAIADMSPDIQQRFQAWRDVYGGFLHLYDGGSINDGKGGIGDIRLIIADELEQGRRPDLVIVDWMQCAVLKGLKSGVGSTREIAEQMDDYARQFAAICRNQQIQGILVQQLSASYQRTRNIALDHKMAEACSTLGKHCQHAVCLGRLTPEGEGFMISSKGVIPSASRPPQPVILNGAMNRFETPTSISQDEQIEQLIAGYKATAGRR